MIELFLDNKPAVLRDNASIKLTRENVYFTKSGSYTYDVELPLSSPQNLAIFGTINRKDVAAHFIEFSALLRVDNVVLLDGKAVLHQLTDTAAKVQLLGGNAEMNFYTKGAELYVDELDLGDWINEIHWTPNPEHHKGSAFTLLDMEHNTIFYNGYQHVTASLDWFERWWSNTEGAYSNAATDKGVMFPVINENASYKEGTSNAEENNMDGGGVIVNGYILRQYVEDGVTKYYPEFRYSWPNGPATNVPQVVPSFQPMLVMMIVKVLKASGYPMEDASEIALLSNSLFRHIFIVTANNRIELNKALPHWTVNEFITQVEHLLGIVIEVDEHNKKSRVIFRDAYWDGNAETTAIDDVVDEYSVEIDKEETTDITNGNVGFADMEDGFEHISDDILGAVEIDKTRFGTIAAMENALSVGAIHREDKGKIFEAQGHQFIVVGESGHYEFQEVNQYRMLQRNTEKRDVDVELKIVPCPITQWDCPLVSTSKNSSGKYTDNVVGSKTVDVFTRPDIEHIGTDSVTTDDEDMDVEALINGESDLPSDEDKADLMYIGVIPAGLSFAYDSIRFYWPRPISVHNWRVKVSGIDPGNSVQQHEFLELHKTFSDSNDKSLFTEAIVADHSIDTTVKHCIKFVTNEVLRPSGMFIIHGQRFACQKLEYSITSKGISKLVTGYFYRLS